MGSSHGSASIPHARGAPLPLARPRRLRASGGLQALLIQRSFVPRRRPGTTKLPRGPSAEPDDTSGRAGMLLNETPVFYQQRLRPQPSTNVRGCASGGGAPRAIEIWNIPSPSTVPSPVQTLISDVQYGIRLLLKTPGFTAVAVLVLALGIGANTAMFSIVNAMLFQLIPANKPDIAGIYSRDTTKPRQLPGILVGRLPASARGARGVRQPPRALDDDGRDDRGDATRRSFAAIVSSNYFSTLGVRLAAGREFSTRKSVPAATPRW